MRRPVSSRPIRWPILACLCSISAAAADWSAATHSLAAGDFNADGRDDLLVIARDPWRSSGIVLSDPGGNPSVLHQVWPSDHLGLDWSAARYRPVIGSFSPGRCTAGHMGTSCVYPDDLLLQSQAPGTTALLFTDHATTTLNSIQQRIPDQHMGLQWSAAGHRITVGHFDRDNYHDLFFQAATPDGSNALVLTASLDGYPASAQARETWSGRWATLDWSESEAVVVSGDFNGDGYDDLLSQGYTPPGDPYGPGRFGIVTGAQGGFANPDGSEPEPWLSWSRRGFLVPDWSAREYILHVGNFNNDRYDDVLLQPRSPGGDAFVVLFGPRESAPQWSVARLPAGAAGLDWSGERAVLVVGDFDGDGRAEVVRQAAQPGSPARRASLDGIAADGTAVLAVHPVEAPDLDRPAGEAGPEPGTAVGAIPGEFVVDATGTATYRVPIRVPPGVRALQPDIALTYHHRSGDELAGRGWSLSGLPRIVRCATIGDPDADGFIDGADLDANDRYCLDGERLVETAQSGEFRTEVDSLRRIRAYGSAGNGPAYFVVEDPSGLTWELGSRADSRLHPRSPGADPSVLVYAVSRVRDAYGNGIDYRWHHDLAATAFRPEQITWQNADGVVIGRLDFVYDLRTDVRPGWFKGYRISRPWRLRRVETRVRNAAGALVPVRRYHLDYAFNRVNGQAHLAAITECEETGGTCLGATRFTAESGRRGFTTVPDSTGVSVTARDGLMLLDIDNSGVADAVYLDAPSPDQARWIVRRDALDGPILDSLPAVDWDSAIVVPVGYRAIPLDSNGDGYIDLAQPSGDQDAPGSRLVIHQGGTDGLDARATSVTTAGRDFWNAGVGVDLDGDGRDDLATAADAQVLVFRSTGEDFATVPWTGPVPGVLPERRLVGPVGQVLRPMNFDGDGRSDLLALAADCDSFPWVGRVCTDYQWLVYALADAQASGPGSLQIVYTFPAGNYMRHPKLLDANGDGLTDLLFFHADNARWELHTATGSGYERSWSAGSLQSRLQDDAAGGPAGFAAAPATPGGDEVLVSLDASLLEHARVLDYDHDGRDDLLIADGASQELRVLMGSPASGGLGQLLVRTGIAAARPQDRQFLRVADLGGDGQPDLLVPDANGRYQLFDGRGAALGLLTGIEDGLGAVTSMAYSDLADAAVYSPQADAPADLEPPVFPYSRLSGPLMVVSESATPTGLASDLRVHTRYAYRDARAHRRGRGFAGFAERRAWNVNQGIATVNRYAQVFPLTGLLRESVQRFAQDIASAQLVEVSIPDYGLYRYPAACDVDGTGELCRALYRRSRAATLEAEADVISRSSSRFMVLETAAGGQGRSYLPVLAEVTDLAFPATTDGPVGTSPSRRVVTTYHSESDPVDAWGNPSRIVVTTDDGSGGSSHTSISSNAWLNRTDRWCPGLQTRATVTLTKHDGVPVTRSREFSYDDRCALSRDIVQPDVASHRVQRDYRYDRFGNRVEQVISGQDFAARRDTAEFGDEFHGRFATRWRNALDQTTLLDWDVRFGARVSSAGLEAGSGVAVKIEAVSRLDGFGRRLSAQDSGSDASAEFAYQWCHAAGCASPEAVYRQTTHRSDGQVETTERDRLGRVVHTTRLNFDGERVHVARHYDALGREFAVSRPYLERDAGRRCYTQRHFDRLQRVAREFMHTRESDCGAALAPAPGTPLAGAGAELRYAYDLPHPEGWVKRQSLYERGNITAERSVVFDGMGQVIQVAEGLDAAQSVVRYQYLADGNLREVAGADGSISRFAYDALGMPLTVDDSALGFRIYQHNGLGELIFERDALGAMTRYDYDALGRLTRRTSRWNYFDPADPDQRVTTFSYDTGPGFSRGQLHQATGPYRLGDGPALAGLQITQRYDERGRLVDRIRRLRTASGPRYFWTSQAYDDEGRLSALVYPARGDDATALQPGAERLRIDYEHNARGFLQRVRAHGEGPVYWETLAVDAAGFHAEVALDDGALRRTRSHDRASGLLSGTRSSRGPAQLQHLLFGWTDGGLLQAREDLVNGRRERFEHDGLQRLRRIERYQAGVLREVQALSYDLAGNPLARDGLGEYRYADDQPQAVVAVAGGPAPGNFAYDANGQMIQRDGASIAWTADGLPASLPAGAGSWQFEYGPHRQRFRRTAASGNAADETLYLGAAAQRQYRSGVAPRQLERILVGREAIALLSHGGTGADPAQYLHRDHIGSTTAVTQGSTVRHLAYDAGGRAYDPARADVAGALPWSDGSDWPAGVRGFGGHESFADSGLVHMNGRVYDARLRRFLSADPYVQFPRDSQGLNRYAFAQNALTAATDPSGYGLGNFFKRLGKKLFFGAPFFLVGQGFGVFAGGFLGDVIGGSISFSISGFMPHGGQSSPALRAPVWGSPGPDLFSVPRDTLILSAAEGTGALRGSAREYAAWRIGQGLGSRLQATANSTQGVDRRDALSLRDEIAQSVAGLAGPELDSRLRREKGRIFVTGHRIGGVGPVHTALEYRDELGVAWISAGPEGIGLEGYRALVGGVGTARNGVRETDAPAMNAVLAEVMPPPGMSAQAYFGELRQATQRYCNCADYDLFPTLGGGYNSNGFVGGLIRATGGQTGLDFSDLVGGGYPLPPAYFGY